MRGARLSVRCWRRSNYNSLSYRYVIFSSLRLVWHLYRRHQAFPEAIREVNLHIKSTLIRCLASENSKQAHEGDDDSKGIQTNIVRKRPNQGSSGSIPINQCHVPISFSPLYEEEVFMHNT